MIKIWKLVFTEANGRWKSYAVMGTLECTYELNETTYPKVGYLFAYNNLSEARSLARFSHCTLLEGYGEIMAERNDIPKIPSPWGTHAEIEHFWRNQEVPAYHWLTPPHTVFLSEFTPTSVVVLK